MAEVMQAACFSYPRPVFLLFKLNFPVFIFFVVLFNSAAMAQDDTIYFNYLGEKNEHLFVKNSIYFNPNYDTIRWRVDSSLYTGYILLSNLYLSATDTISDGTDLYYLSAGILSRRETVTYLYTHPITNERFKWKKWESFSTDTSHLQLEFFPNGQIAHRYTGIYYGPGTDSFRQSEGFDSTGVLIWGNERKNELNHGAWFNRLNDSVIISVDYAYGQFEKLTNEDGIFFNARNRIVSEDKFAEILLENPTKSWGFIVTDSPCQSNPDLKFALYIRRKTNSLYLLQENNGLSKGRGKKLVRRTRRSCSKK